MMVCFALKLAPKFWTYGWYSLLVFPIFNGQKQNTMNGMGLPLSNSHPQRSRPWSAHNLNSWDIAFLVFVDAAERRTCFVVLFGCSLFPDGGGRVGKLMYAGWMRIFPNLTLRAFWQDCPNPKLPAVLPFENVKKIDIQTAKLGFPTVASIEIDVTWQLFFGYKWICVIHTLWLKRVILTTSSSCTSFDIHSTSYIFLKFQPHQISGHLNWLWRMATTLAPLEQRVVSIVKAWRQSNQHN